MPLTSIYDRTFGAEFEVPTNKAKQDLVHAMREAGLRVTDTAAYTHGVTEGWKVVTDSSIKPCGWELVSPILKGMEGLKEIVKFCRVLRGLGLDIPGSNTSVGFHVHIGADDLDGDAVARLIRFHNHIERHGLLECLPKSRAENKFCKATHPEILEEAKVGPITFKRAREISQDRNVALNMFKRCADYGTVEFRRHQGTLNPMNAVSWILLNLHMVEASKSLGRKGYGADLKRCFSAIKMDENGEKSKWAGEYLLQRREQFKRRRYSYPPMPAALEAP